jgi:hypothetical protein
MNDIIKDAHESMARVRNLLGEAHTSVLIEVNRFGAGRETLDFEIYHAACGYTDKLGSLVECEEQIRKRSSRPALEARLADAQKDVERIKAEIARCEAADKGDA